MEEDEEYLYIIEEYIEGESLKTFVLNQKSISLETAISFTIQICNIIEYLHELKPYPVLHLDLKPDNIIVCRNVIKIIDFGSSVFMKDMENLKYSFGTAQFAAPEQMTSLKLDKKTDEYAIGTILYFMLSGKIPQKDKNQLNDILELNNIPVQIKDIILKTTQKHPDDRYKDVVELKEKLKELVQERKNLLITVAGTQNRIGTSYFAISLVTYLNSVGINTLYMEENDNIIEKIANENKYAQEKEGIYHIGSFQGMPHYGSTVSVDRKKYKIIVRDCGVLDKNIAFYNGDIKIVIAGAREWEIDNLRYWNKCLKDLEIKWVIKEGEKNSIRQNLRELEIKEAYIFPYKETPFKTDARTERIFSKLVSKKIMSESGDENGSMKKKEYLKKRGKFFKKDRNHRSIGE